jgi:hypothetical protein
VRSYQREDRASFLRNGDRYTLISFGGQVEVRGPPPAAADPHVRQAAQDVVAALENDQVVWVATFGEYNHELSIDVDLPDPVFETAAKRAEENFKPADLAHPLLAALEDPSRFVAAHLLLRRATPSWRNSLSPLPTLWGAAYSATELDDFRDRYGDKPWVRVDYDGLKITLRRWQGQPWPTLISKDLQQEWLAGDPEPEQLPAIREQWHRRLDVHVATVPYWPAAGAMILPLAWIARRIHRRRLRRHRLRCGFCVTCGFDLRASPQRCPECGTLR